jgi:hypothetical protein
MIDADQPYAAFDGVFRIAQGPLGEVALSAKRAMEDGGAAVLIFDATGRVVDVDVRGDDAAVLARLGQPVESIAEPRGRGRPKLGVVSREVTLLPRHWEWLNAQPGGASVALRKLVDEARRSAAATTRQRQEAAYRFASAIAGDFPNYEEAMRALFAGDLAKFAELMAAWPGDVREHAMMLAGATDNRGDDNA